MKMKKSARWLHCSKIFKTNLKTHRSPLLIRPQGCQGCQKMSKEQLNMQFEGWCANIDAEKNKQGKIVKIGKKCQKTPVFLDIFEYSSMWGQY